MTTILIFRSADNREYDKYIQAPDLMSMAVAVPAADAIIKQVKAKLPEWQWEDLESALEARDFKGVCWAHCEQKV